jgi:hypothetical protein
MELTTWEKSHFWESDIRSASQESPAIYETPEVHHRVHNSPSLDPTMRQSALTFTTKILYAFLNIPIRVTCPIHFVLLGSICVCS